MEQGKAELETVYEGGVACLMTNVHNLKFFLWTDDHEGVGAWNFARMPDSNPSQRAMWADQVHSAAIRRACGRIKDGDSATNRVLGREIVESVSSV